MKIGGSVPYFYSLLNSRDNIIHPPVQMKVYYLLRWMLTRLSILLMKNRYQPGIQSPFKLPGMYVVKHNRSVSPTWELPFLEKCHFNPF